MLRGRAGGRLNVGNGPDGMLRAGYRNAAGANCPARMDVSAQSPFTVNVGEFSLGYSNFNGALTTIGTACLATNNSVTATNVLIGASVYTSSAVTNLMRLGAGTNDFNTPVLTVGGRKQNGPLTLPAGGCSSSTMARTARTSPWAWPIFPPARIRSARRIRAAERLSAGWAR